MSSMNQMNQPDQSASQGSMSSNNTGSNMDPQVQRDLNPNPNNLDPNDPNVAKDPVCGTLLDKRTAQDTISPAIGTNMQTLYFCSADCKAIFEQNPERFGYTNF